VLTRDLKTKEAKRNELNPLELAERVRLAVTVIAAVITRSMGSWLDQPGSNRRPLYRTVDASFCWNAGTGQWRRQ
jgi:hypothetical protein